MITTRRGQRRASARGLLTLALLGPAVFPAWSLGQERPPEAPGTVEVKVEPRGPDELPAATPEELRSMKELAKASKTLDEVFARNAEALAKIETAAREKLAPETTLQIGDRVKVALAQRAFANAQISGTYDVRTDGTISFGLGHPPLFVLDLTRRQAKEKLIGYLRTKCGDENLGLVKRTGDGPLTIVEPGDSDQVLIDFASEHVPRGASGGLAAGAGGGGMMGGGPGMASMSGPALGGPLGTGLGGAAVEDEGAIAFQAPGTAASPGTRPFPPPTFADDEASLAVKERMNAVLVAPFKGPVALREYLDFLGTETKGAEDGGLRFHVDKVGLDALGHEMETEVSPPVSMPLKTGLRLTLRQLSLTYLVKDGTIIVTNPESVAELLRDEE